MSARFAKRHCGECDRQVLVTAEGRCPHCHISLSDGEGPRVVEVTLSPAVEQPHVCLLCGAPTHRRVRVRVRGPRPAPAPRQTAEVPWMLHLIPGGLGCLVSIVTAIAELPVDAVLRRRPTISLRVRQCTECARTGRPRGFSPRYEQRRLSFEAHPRFAEALARLIRDAQRQGELRATPPRGDDKARPGGPS